jgi:hypothetical protein
MKYYYKDQFILLDINTIQRYFQGESHVKMCERMLLKIRRIFALTRLKNIPVISIIPENTKKETYTKSKFSRRTDSKTYESINTTDLPEHHDQLILRNPYSDPLNEPRIDRVLTEINDRFNKTFVATMNTVIAIGIGTQLTKTVLRLLIQQQPVIVLRDLVRFPGKSTEGAEREIVMMESKGAEILSLKDFVQESTFSAIKEWPICQ